MTPFGKGGVERGLSRVISMIWISQFSSEENLSLVAVSWKYVFTFVSGVLEPLSDCPSDIGFITIPSSTIDMAIPSLESNKHRIVAFLRSGLIDSQPNYRDGMTRIELRSQSVA